MKLITAFLVTILPQILFAQNFEINLKIIDPENKVKDNSECDLSTYTRVRFAGPKHIYKTTVDNKQAKFKDTIGTAEVAMLGLKFDSESIAFKIVIDPDATYEVTYDVQTQKLNVLSNSKSDNLMRFFFKKSDSLSKLKGTRIALHKQFIAAENLKSADSVLKLVDGFERSIRNLKKRIAAENPNNILSAYLLINNYEYDLEEQKIYENLTVEIQNTSYGVALKKSIDAYLRNLRPEKQAELVNEDLTPIAAHTLAGDLVILDKEYFKKNSNELTLVEFWASWCAPCKQSLQDLYSFYYLNKAKKFNVILVSLDDDMDSWKKATLNDNYPWLNISDGKGHSSVIPKNYKIKAIPANILVNAQGNIISKNITDLEVIKNLLDK